MAKILISNVAGLDGEYELELGRFTHGELRTIKREANVRAGEIEEAMRAGDTDLLVAFALIALRRAGRGDIAPERLWEADAGSVDIDLTDEAEDDAGPPEPSTASAESGSGRQESSSPNTSDDGVASQET